MRLRNVSSGYCQEKTGEPPEMRHTTIARALWSVLIAPIAVLGAQAVQPLPALAADNVTGHTGAVYTMTNDPSDNEVLAFQRGSDGSLRYLASYATGGRGSGGSIDPLQSQSSIVLGASHHFLFAVNSGSGTISTFQVAGSGRLSLIGVTVCGGAFPVSIALHGNLLFVLNSSGGGNITGFLIGDSRGLSQIPGSTRALSGANVGGSTLAFSPDGQFLIASERNTGNLDTFEVEPDGTAFGPVFSTSNSPGPFATAFTSRGILLVTEAPTATVSSYAVASDGGLNLITGSVSTAYKATCWIVPTSDGAYAFAADAGSGEISELSIDWSGDLTVTGAAATAPGATPLDLALSSGDHYLYALTAGAGTITEYSVSSGALTSLGTIAAVPAASGQNGLAAF
jgi:6-phosphogluconolactonase